MNKFWKLSMRAATAAISVGGAISTSAGQPHTPISEADARKTALEATPSGTIQSAELETENARLVWSFDLARPKTSVITEIQVDATTGRIVSNRLESLKEQAHEARADKSAKR
jgi:uncharacterized membrane protein YkoI